MSVAFTSIIIKFLIAGMNLPVVGEMPDMSVLNFGIAITGVLAIWQHREGKEKDNLKKSGDL